MRIQVLTRDNGYGLSKDVQVVREALEPLGHEVDFTPYDRPRIGSRYHLNIHLELLNPSQFQTGQVNVFVPNPEWMMQDYPRYFGGVDQIWAKTRDTEHILKQLHPNVSYTGWTSPDPGVQVDHAEPKVVHLAGNSSAKGTEAVIEAARLLPHIPFTITGTRPRRSLSRNVKLHSRRLNEAEFTDIRQANIHLCPSTYEGFGHYINEAKAMGAVIVTTGDGPMAELVAADFGILSPVCRLSRTHFAQEHHVCPDALADCIEIAWAGAEEHGPTWGARARASYEAERVAFHERIKGIVK